MSGGELVPARDTECWAGLPVPRNLWEHPEAREAIRAQLRRELLEVAAARGLALAGGIREAVVRGPRPGEALRVEFSAVVRKRAA